MLKSIMQYGVCLLVGAAAGYQLRSPQQAAAVASAVLQPVATAKAGQAAGTWDKADKAADARAEENSARMSASLGERMKGLLERYNDAAARKDVYNLSEAEVQLALSLVAAMPKSTERDSLIENLYRAWAKTNPNAAWKAALAELKKTDKNHLGTVAGEVARTNPTEAIRLALSLGGGSQRSTVFSELFLQWGKVDVNGAVAYLNKHPDLPASSWIMSNAISETAEKDPAQAAKLAMTMTDSQSRSYSMSTVMRKWAERDPKAAWDWVQNIENPTLRQEAMGQALSGWVGKDSRAAMDMAQAIKDPGVRAAVMKSTIASWFSKDPDAAMAYLSLSKDEKVMRDMGWQIANTLETLTTQERTALLGKLPEGKSKEDIYQAMAYSQTRRGQFNQAVEMLNNMPDSSNRDYALQNLGKSWAESDLKGATAWLKLQPDSSDRDVAVAGYVNVLARTDPQGALQWADTIPDEGVKSGTLRSIVARWLNSDPARAEKWLTGTTAIPEGEKQNIRDNAIKYGPDRMSYGINVNNRH
ncbi:MAG: hypothetical protein JWO08_1859 [Verrucomicrobiaceae bacterium]|nr:hypothetical protein [Verrucomicrobiaceae bacterium]